MRVESKICADKQQENCARKRPRGKPFAKGNSFAWKPGQSGNPSGRPKVRTISEAYRKYLAEVDPEDPQGRTRAEVAAERLYKLTEIEHPAAVGAFRELADRSEGKPRQAVEIDLKKQAAERLALALGVPLETILEPDNETAMKDTSRPRNTGKRS